MAKRLSTRGRSSKGDRIFGVTSGGLEVSKELLLKIAAVAELEPNEQCLENLQKLVNLRITETRRPYLTWNESEKVVNSFVSSAKSLISDIERVADLGEDPVARPHGQTLLNFLDCDFEREVRHHKASWDDVLAWLRFVSARIEGQFIEVNSRSGDYRDFIFNCYYELSLQNTLPQGQHNKALTLFLEALEQEFPNLVFPPDSVSHSRYEYVRNAMRAKKGK
ncbi:MAG: hypothetical protein AAF922_06310 [Pseudomonadota bacterium]